MKINKLLIIAVLVGSVAALAQDESNSQAKPPVLTAKEVAQIKAQEFSRTLAQLTIQEIAIQQGAPVDEKALAVIRSQRDALDRELVDLAGTAVTNKDAGDFTPWMDKTELDAFIKSLDGDKPEGKNFWQRGHWITAVEGRWHEGKPEHRIRYEDTPKGKSLTWYWWLNANQKEWADHVEKYADDGFTLKHWTSYLRPDGRIIYDAVWYKVEELK